LNLISVMLAQGKRDDLNQAHWTESMGSRFLFY